MATKNKHLGAEIGAGAVAAAALAVAGGYILWERMGKTKQAKVKTWVAKARKHAVVNIAKAKSMSEGEYKRIVDQAVKHYGTLSDVNKAELSKVAADMKSEWKHIQAQAKVMAAQMQKDGKSVVKKAKTTTKRAVAPKKKAAKRK